MIAVTGKMKLVMEIHAVTGTVLNNLSLIQNTAKDLQFSFSPPKLMTSSHKDMLLELDNYFS